MSGPKKSYQSLAIFIAVLVLLRLFFALGPVSEITNKVTGQIQAKVSKIIANNENTIYENSDDSKDSAIIIENQELQKELELNKTINQETTAIQIVAKDLNSIRKILVLNPSSELNIKIGAPVFARGYFIGSIGSVEPGRAEVILVNDPTFRATVMTKGFGDQGILKTEFGSLILDLVPSPSAENLPLVTSGVDGKYPAGLLIGKTGERIEGAESVFNRYQVVLPVNPADLEFVNLIKDGN